MEKKIKILFVIPYYVPAFSYGGPVKVSSDLAESLVEKGHSVTVVTTDVLDNKNRINVKSEVINGVLVVRIKNISNYLAKKFNLYLPLGFKDWMKVNVAKYDIVHCHDFFTILNIFTSIYCKKHNIPYVIQPHGCLDMIRQKSKLFYIKQFFLFLFKGVVKEAKNIIALVDKEKKEIENIYPDISSKIIIIQNGIDLEKHKNIKQIDLHYEYNIPNNNRIIVFLGRVQYIKGLDISIKSLAIIKNKIDFTFLIIGPDEGEKNKLDKLIKNCGLSDQIIFAGILEGEEKLATLKGADLFLLNSRSEGFGLTIIESCAVGVPVLLSENCPINEVVKFNAGRVTSNMKDDISRNILEMLQDDQLLGEYKQNTYKVAEYYSLGLTIKKNNNLYRKIIN